MSVRRCVVVLVTVLLLSACSADDPDPVADPSSTVSSSSPSSEPSPSVAPEPSEEPESAAEFIRRWFFEYVAMQASGESNVFREMSRGCAECAAMAGRFEAIYSAGGSVQGGEVTVTDIRRIGRLGKSETWIAEFDANPTSFRESAGAAIQKLEGGHAGFRFVLKASRGVFRIGELYQESL